MLVVGLTGGIGSGKSTAARLFAQLGVTVIDADIIAREVVKRGEPTLGKIAEYFGHEVLDEQGNLDRQKLRAIIFEDGSKRIWLEQLLHPLIRAQMHQQIVKATSSYCILVIPLLIEAIEPNELVNRILVVDAPEAMQIERTQQRDQLTVDEVKAILHTQATRAERLRKADDVIENDRDFNYLCQQVYNLHKTYLLLAGLAVNKDQQI